MSYLILLVVIFFAPPEALVLGLTIFAGFLLFLAFFYVSARLWIVTVGLIPARFALESIRHDPALVHMPVMEWLPFVASMVEALAAVILIVSLVLGMAAGRSVMGASLSNLIASWWRQVRT